MVELAITETSGGLAGVYGVGVRQGLKERGLTSYIGAERAASAGTLNMTLGALGTIDEGLAFYQHIGASLINRAAAIRRFYYSQRLKHVRKYTNHTPLRRVIESISEHFVNMDCLHELLDDVCHDWAMEKVGKHAHPLLAHVANAQTRQCTYFDIRQYGMAAIRASSAVVGRVKIDGVPYTDSWTIEQMDLERWPELERYELPKYELLIVNKGRRSYRARLEERIFINSKTRGGYRQHALREKESQAKVDEIRSKDIAEAIANGERATLVLQPAVRLSFTTSDRDALRKGWERGKTDAARVEQLLELLDRKAA